MTQRHETELALVKSSFEFQLSGNRQVIATLQAALDGRDAEVERLQNELGATQANPVAAAGQSEESDQSTTPVARIFE